MECTHSGTLEAAKQKEVRSSGGKWVQLKWSASGRQTLHAILLSLVCGSQSFYRCSRTRTDDVEVEGSESDWE